MDNWQIEAIEAAAKAEGEVNEKQAYALIDALRRAIAERDEARSFAQGVYRWGPRMQHAVWEAQLPWLKE